MEPYGWTPTKAPNADTALPLCRGLADAEWHG